MSGLPLMLFAAGFGTRMGHLTAHRPKPMIPVAGRPLIDHAIALGRGAGVTRIVANTHYLPHMIEPHLSDEGVVVSHEAPEILDTGGGLVHALPLLGDGPVLTLNTDALWTGPNPLSTLAEAWEDGMDALLLCVPPDRAHGREGPGDFTLTDGRLSRGGDMIYTGAQIIQPHVLGAARDRVFSLSRIWTDLAARGTLRGIVHEGHWADVGHPGGIALAEAMLADV
ncbi:nucleotidyltransferase family protein [Palleronia sp. LCG004]|uniref:nucleotidyltransferase family protein n=1 Tax=Palleronia sp. LCG004 TaxID=3079304 RepID=UPI002941EAD9|nr:nucleotidyltransferase family protein [Palleronia sp. LCG004]WOI55924.1 nucleotidyltransferase family protein [Palleronia sp. LCG004]